ncbi:MAG: hypothetical protein IJA65_01105 [Acholeplasmatales bacterium]|nr:hypothetical protein [Acholeplasmatales bacterium]
MLKKLFEMNCFDYKTFILDNTKKLSLTSDEAVVLIKILEEYKVNKNFSIDSILSSISMTKSNLENILAILMEKEYYEVFISYDAGLGEETISIDGFFKKVKDILENKADVDNTDLYQVTKLMTTKLNRILTSQEIEIITSLVLEDRYTLANFESACKKLEDKKKLITIKTIAQVLAKKEEPEIKPNNAFVKDFFNSIK